MGSSPSKDLSSSCNQDGQNMSELTPVISRTKHMRAAADLDPRSPTFGIARTPLQLASHTAALLDDPRSPTIGIERTPIQVSSHLMCDSTLRYSTAESTHAQFATCTKLIDPRSPTVGIERTPIHIGTGAVMITDPRSPTLGVERTPLQVYNKANFMEISKANEFEENGIYPAEVVTCKIPDCIEATELKYEEHEELAAESEEMSVDEADNADEDAVFPLCLPPKNEPTMDITPVPSAAFTKLRDVDAESLDTASSLTTKFPVATPTAFKEQGVIVGRVQSKDGSNGGSLRVKSIDGIIQVAKRSPLTQRNVNESVRQICLSNPSPLSIRTGSNDSPLKIVQRRQVRKVESLKSSSFGESMMSPGIGSIDGVRKTPVAAAVCRMSTDKENM